MKNLYSSEEGLLKRFFINMTIGTTLDSFYLVPVIALLDRTFPSARGPVLSAK
nr:MAG TPA: hypothetical protein [Caudoviricetes sp.]